MGRRFVIPDGKAIGELLEMVFGDTIEVTEHSAPDAAGRYVATFLDDEDALVAVCACDWPFVCYSAAALAMIPPSRANEIVDSGEVTETISDTFYEVMNISSKLMMSDQSAHLRLDKTFDPENGAAPLTQLGEAERVSSFQLTIPRYGQGGMTFFQNRV